MLQRGECFDLALVVVVLRFFSHNKFAAGRMKQMRGGENRKVAAPSCSRGRQSALKSSLMNAKPAPPDPSERKPRSDFSHYLPRLRREFYQADAVVFWTMR